MIQNAENNYAEGLLIKSFLSLKSNRIKQKIKSESKQRAKVFCDTMRGKRILKDFSRLVKIIKAEKLRNEALDKILKDLFGKHNKKCNRNRFSILTQYAKQKGKAFGILSKVLLIFKVAILRKAYKKLKMYSEDKRKSLALKTIGKAHLFKKRASKILKYWKKHTVVMQKTDKFINKKKNHILQM